MRSGASRTGFVLPIVVACILVVAIIAGGMLNYVLYGTRVTGVYITASQCRLASQSALDQTKVDIQQAFKTYYHAYPSSWDVLSWFNTHTAQGIGVGGYACTLMRDRSVNGCRVTVTIQGVERPPVGEPFQYAHVTLQATATGDSAAGVEVSKMIEETVEYALRRSSVFDHAYFMNNYGWFRGNGVVANGDVRANGDLLLDGIAYINGFAYAAPNTELGASGLVIGAPRFMSRDDYWDYAGLRTRPTSPASDGAGVWLQGYDAAESTRVYSHQEELEMPYLGDLEWYRMVANNTGGTIKQNGVTLVSGCFNGNGPSGLATGADKGSIVLDGTAAPIEISGPVVIEGDVIIKGTVRGQGVIYAGRNIHVVGNVTYGNAPVWPKPDPSPAQTVKNNAGKDMLGLVSKGNIVIGNYKDPAWMNAVKEFIGPPFVKAYSSDPTDASIGYPSMFSGNYTAADSGQKVKYLLNKKTKKYEPSSTEDRAYYESAIGDLKITEIAQSGEITHIDAVLYNNHAVMGTLGPCQFNGAVVSRDDGLVFNATVSFNWDIRLGSRSPDGSNFFIYLPMSVANPRVIGWREVL